MFNPEKAIKKMLGPGVNVPSYRQGRTAGDIDGDGIPNLRDCQPKNMFRQDNNKKLVSFGYSTYWYGVVGGKGEEIYTVGNMARTHACPDIEAKGSTKKEALRKLASIIDAGEIPVEDRAPVTLDEARRNHTKWRKFGTAVKERDPVIGGI